MGFKQVRHGESLDRKYRQPQVKYIALQIESNHSRGTYALESPSTSLARIHYPMRGYVRYTQAPHADRADLKNLRAVYPFLREYLGRVLLHWPV